MDFNARSVDDPLWSENPDINAGLDLFLHELEIIFAINKTSILGNREYGMSIEYMLWSTSFNAEHMQNVISDQIYAACYSAKDFRWSVEVQLVKGLSKDIGIITVSISDKEDQIIATPKYVFK